MTGENKHDDWLTAAECAARTGLTVRALHVYERYELIAPRRTSKGWRQYGQPDIARLNIIAALKAVGLSLSQIQEIVRANPPSLERILEIQVETWRQRKADAERGMALAEAALAQTQSRRSVSMEDLCNLILNFETSNMRRVLQEILDDQFTPAERQQLGAWTTSHWQDGEEQAETFLRTRTEAWKLVSAGAEPSSVEAQEMISRLMAHERETSVFERVRAGAGSILGADKGESVAKALVERMNRDPAPGDRLAVELFIDNARQVRLGQSEGWTQFAETSAAIVSDIRRLVAAGADPGSAEARAVLDRFTELGRVFTMGDPVFYALWAHEKGPARKDLWEFVGQAERVRRTAGN